MSKVCRSPTSRSLRFGEPPCLLRTLFGLYFASSLAGHSQPSVASLQVGRAAMGSRVVGPETSAALIREIQTWTSA